MKKIPTVAANLNFSLPLLGIRLIKCLPYILSLLIAIPNLVIAQVPERAVATVQEKSLWALSGQKFKNLTQKERDDLKVEFLNSEKKPIARLNFIQWSSNSQAKLLMPPLPYGVYSLKISAGTKLLFNYPIRIVSRNFYTQRIVATKGIAVVIDGVVAQQQRFLLWAMPTTDMLGSAAISSSA